jgi:hypothetical protein
MSATQSLSTLAVRSLFEGFCHSIGFPLGPAAAEAASRFLTGRFADHSQKLNEILTRAVDRAWRALELALAGDSWWDRVKTMLHSREEQAFREQVGAFLRVTPLDNLPFHPPAFRANALRDLRTARKAGLLAGTLDTTTLAQQGAAFARYADPLAVLEAEWQTLGGLIEQLRTAGHRDLADFLSLRPAAEMPLLVVAVRYFFRREMEDDPALMAALSFAKLEQLSSTQEAGFDALSTLLAKNAQRLDGLLEQALTLLTETHADVKEIKADLALLGQTTRRLVSRQGRGARPQGDVCRRPVSVELRGTPRRGPGLVTQTAAAPGAARRRFHQRSGGDAQETACTPTDAQGTPEGRSPGQGAGGDWSRGPLSLVAALAAYRGRTLPAPARGQPGVVR